MTIYCSYDEDRIGAFSLLTIFSSRGCEGVTSYVVFDFSKIALYRGFDSINV